MAQLSPVIRSARPTDVLNVARIYVDSWNVGFGKLMPARELTEALVVRWTATLAAPVPHHWWIADVDGVSVGFAGIGPSRDPIDANLGELDTIAVTPAWWRSGIGGALMTMALQTLRADIYREAVVWTLARYTRGQRFYEATGWQVDGGIRDDGRQVRYRQRLAP